MMIAIVPIVAMLIGGAVYALAGHPKASEMGRLTFFAGVVVLVYVLAHVTLKVG